MTANPKNYADVWREIPWKSLEKSLDILQNRIYKAIKNNDIARVKRLQRLLIYSQSSKLLAIRDVTQITTEKKKTGFSYPYSLTKKQKLKLATSIRIHPSERYDIRVSKSNEPKKSLFIFNVKDRVCQCVIKYALEPIYRANASFESYKFWPKKNVHKTQSAVLKNIRDKGHNIFTEVLKLKMEKCFDKMEHSKFLNLIVLPSFAIKILRQALAGGLFLQENRHTKNGIQAGIISPLLINIALHGLENIHNKQKKSNISLHRGLRHDGNVIFFLKNKEESESLRQKLDTFLAKRGLNIESLDTEIKKIIDGFDFLGWTFKVKLKSGKSLCYPTLESKKNLTRNIKEVMTDVRYSLQDRAKKINLIYKDWSIYHKNCYSSKTSLWFIKRWSYDYIVRKSSLPRVKRLELIKSIFD